MVVPTACTNLGCPCREISLTAYRVDDRLIGVNLTRDVVEFYFPKEDEVASQHERTCVLKADLDMDTGQVAIADSAPADQQDAMALAWLREELDGQVLDHLANQVLRRKGLRPLSRMDIRNFKQGDMLGFGEAYLHGRIDAYIMDGRRLDVLDLYCVDPACPCTEIRFWTLCNGREMGTIRMDVGGTMPPRFEGEPVLAQLWQAIRRRYPSLDVFRKREAKMKQAGPSILAQAATQRSAASPAISRNQPCPCGSGKKYKRCCIGKRVPPPTI